MVLQVAGVVPADLRPLPPSGQGGKGGQLPLLLQEQVDVFDPGGQLPGRLVLPFGVQMTEHAAAGGAGRDDRVRPGKGLAVDLHEFGRECAPAGTGGRHAAAGLALWQQYGVTQTVQQLDRGQTDVWIQVADAAAGKKGHGGFAGLAWQPLRHKVKEAFFG